LLADVKGMHLFRELRVNEAASRTDAPISSLQVPTPMSHLLRTRFSLIQKPLALAAATLLLSAIALPAAATNWWNPTPALTIGTASVNVRDKGALGNGVHDDTAAFQAAVNALPSTGGTVVVPPGTYMINALTSVRLRSKMRLQLDPLAQVKAIANSSDRYIMFKLWNLNNVEITGGQIIGERVAHVGTTGQWGYGVAIQGSSKVFVHDISISNCWGDGIFIGTATSGTTTVKASDVTLNQVVSTNNRRQGLSITPAQRVYVVNSTFTGQNGTAPQAGIDIEPGKLGATYVRIENSNLSSNVGNGLELHAYVANLDVVGSTLKNNHGYGALSVSATFGNLVGNTFNQNGLAGVGLNSTTHDFAVVNNSITFNSTRYVSPTSTKGSATRDLSVASTTSNITLSGNLLTGQ